MIFLEKEIKKWANSYDVEKYPAGIYEDLVINQIPNSNKIELMGAWKTGSLRLDNETSEPVYIDSSGSKYKYTNRWKSETPVGYDSWRYISENISKITPQLPIFLNREEKPEILKELERMKGFGNIWGLFVMHCLYPETYPLYDQHVYRAFKYLVTEGQDKPNLAPNKWSEYCSYADFFNKKISITKADAIILDRALWTFGKSLKASMSLAETKQTTVAPKSGINSNDWCRLTTLGGKAKPFLWRLNEDMSLTIMREFNNIPNELTISEDEICRLQAYLGSNKVALANNVAKLGAGTEKEGIGSFLYDDLQWKNTAKAQLASQIAAIFTYSEIWGYNKTKNMEFWNKSKDWRNNLNQFKEHCQSSELEMA